jgi:hypothetical protein
MEKNRRDFLKVIALAATVVPVVGNAQLIGLSKSTKRITADNVPQANVGGDLAGLDLSQFYRNTK